MTYGPPVHRRAAVAGAVDRTDVDIVAAVDQRAARRRQARRRAAEAASGRIAVEGVAVADHPGEAVARGAPGDVDRVVGDRGPGRIVARARDRTRLRRRCGVDPELPELQPRRGAVPREITGAQPESVLAIGQRSTRELMWISRAACPRPYRRRVSADVERLRRMRLRHRDVRPGPNRRCRPFAARLRHSSAVPSFDQEDTGRRELRDRRSDRLREIDISRYCRAPGADGSRSAGRRLAGPFARASTNVPDEPSFRMRVAGAIRRRRRFATRRPQCQIGERTAVSPVASSPTARS